MKELIGYSTDIVAGLRRWLVPLCFAFVGSWKKLSTFFRFPG